MVGGEQLVVKRARCGVGGGRVHYTCRLCDQGLIRGNQVELLTSCSPPAHLLFTLCLTYACILYTYMVSIVCALSNHCSTNPSVMIKCTDKQVISCSPPAHLLLTFVHRLLTFCSLYPLHMPLFCTPLQSYSCIFNIDYQC